MFTPTVPMMLMTALAGIGTVTIGIIFILIWPEE